MKITTNNNEDLIKIKNSRIFGLLEGGKNANNNNAQQPKKVLKNNLKLANGKTKLSKFIQNKLIFVLF